MATSNKKARTIVTYETEDESVPLDATHVTIHGGVTRIGDRAFADRGQLVEIILPEYPTIGGGERVIEVTFPEPLTEIGCLAFRNCVSLQQVDLSTTAITRIDSWAFVGCTSLVKVILPESLQWVREGAFQCCTSLLEIDLSKLESLVFVDRLTFKDCTSLKKIMFPDTLEVVSQSAFQFCSSLTVVDLSRTKVEALGDDAFSGCSLLNCVHLPTTVKFISYRVFENCRSLSFVVIPDEVKVSSPSDECFNGCGLIERVIEGLELSNTSRSIVEDYKFLQYQHRFASVPLHTICYDATLTTEKLRTYIEKMGNGNDSTINGVDCFSMNALHMLCMNPIVTPSMISTLINVCSELKMMRSLEGLTPLMMYLKVNDLLPYDEDGNVDTSVERVSLRECLLEHGVDWDVIEILFELDEEMKAEITMKNEDSDFYLFMEVAINESSGSLKQLYNVVYSAPQLLSKK